MMTCVRAYATFPTTALVLNLIEDNVDVGVKSSALPLEVTRQRLRALVDSRSLTAPGL